MSIFLVFFNYTMVVQKNIVTVPRLNVCRREPWSLRWGWGRPQNVSRTKTRQFSSNFKILLIFFNIQIYMSGLYIWSTMQLLQHAKSKVPYQVRNWSNVAICSWISMSLHCDAFDDKMIYTKFNFFLSLTCHCLPELALGRPRITQRPCLSVCVCVCVCLS